MYWGTKWIISRVSRGFSDGDHVTCANSANVVIHADDLINLRLSCFYCDTSNTSFQLRKPLNRFTMPLDSQKNDNPVTFVTSALGNGVSGVTKTVGGVVGAGGRGIGQTVTGVTGSAGKSLGDAIESLGNGVEGASNNLGNGVEKAGKGQKDFWK